MTKISRYYSFTLQKLHIYFHQIPYLKVKKLHRGNLYSLNGLQKLPGDEEKKTKVTDEFPASFRFELDLVILGRRTKQGT